MSITRIGLDTAKSVFQLHGVDEVGKVQIKRKLQRREMIPYFEKLEPCIIYLEACGAGHYWARILIGLGHDVKLIPPEAVRPFVKKGKKNDPADAAALCEAGGRPDIKFVPVKTEEQQAMLAVHSVRALLVKQQTMLSNAMRGLAAEFGLIVPKGIDKLVELMAQVDADENVPKQGRLAVQELFDQREFVAERIETLEAEIVAHARQNEAARRLATIPGVGPIAASLIAASVADFSVFKRGRDFAAWLGLVPRQHSTAGKTRLGKITKAGNREIRTLLVLGATSMTFRAPQWKSAAGVWADRLLQRKPFRLVTVALANKIARIAWALMTRNEVYQANGRVVTAAEAVA